MTNGNKLYDMIPAVKRCREYHLYDYKGNRYLDMYLDQGRALMGHKPGKCMLAMKNSLEKGLWTPYPSIYEHRLKKLLGNIFSDFTTFSFFRNSERAEKVIKILPEKTAYWQPLSKEQINPDQILIIKPLLPGIQTTILASNKAIDDTDQISPYIIEGLIRNFHDYLSFEKIYNRSIWTEFDKYDQWKRTGPALLFAGNTNEYETVFKRALENKVLLPYTREIPATIPAQLSSYELKCIQKAFETGETP